MSTTKKKVSVTKRPSAEQIQDSKWWDAFIMAASQVDWNELSEEWKDFFEVIGDTSSTTEKMIRYIDIAIAKDEKK